MRILYVSASYVPSRRANAVQVMKMCAALARAGHKVTLLTKANPSREEEGVEDVFAYYGVEPSFRIVPLPRPSGRGGGAVYYRELGRRLRAESADLVYAREIVGGYLAARAGRPVLYEAHDPPQGRLAPMILRRLYRARGFRRLVLVSRALEAEMEAAGTLPEPTRVVVARNGADPPPPLPTPTRNANGFHAGYVGSLFDGRGVEVVVEVARRLPDLEFDVVGGTGPDLERWRRVDVPSNVRFHGFVAPGEVPELYARFDVLLMPYQRRIFAAMGRIETGRWASPLKMFEYMATGIPIVSSDLPIVREVLRHEENALLVDPEDMEGWTRAVGRLRDDADLRQRLGRAAREDVVEEHTWDRRVERVLHGL